MEDLLIVALHTHSRSRADNQSQGLGLDMQHFFNSYEQGEPVLLLLILRLAGYARYPVKIDTLYHL